MTPSKILFYLSLSFIAGIFFESLVEIPQIFVFGVFILGIIIIFSFLLLKNNFFIIAGFCFLFLCLGILRIQANEFKIKNNELRKFNESGVINLTGYICGDPDVRNTYQRIKVKIGESVVLITTNRYPEYKYLDTIKVEGELETPQETEDFSYKNYLMKDGIYSVMFFPKVELAETSKTAGFWQKFYSLILLFKQKIRQSIQKNFSPPQSSILEGTILGDNGAMSEDLKNKLNITGLRHIIAVSGTHVVILSVIIMSILLMFPIKKGKAFYFTIILIFLYAFLTGLPASGVRASIMGSLYLFAQKLGRQSIGIRVIVLACCVMLFINPMLLIYDVGFQLSFLAVIGLIYLEPVFSGFLDFWAKRIFHEVKEKASGFIKIVSSTFAAQVFTLPIIIYSFGNISFVSPITNLLVLPVVYWLMIFGFLSAFLGIFSGLFGWVFSVPCYFVLSYFLWVIDFFSQDWAIKNFNSVHWIWLVICYLVIGYAVRLIRKKYIQNFII
jgi:competence protein ComEC